MSTQTSNQSIILPPDIASFIAQIEDANQRASALVSDLNDSQANWRPNQGKSWSVTQCLDHIAATNRVYLAALIVAATRAKAGHTPLQSAGLPSRYFLQKTEPPVVIRIKAPTSIQPPSTISKSEALSYFLQANEDVRKFAVDTAGLDLCGVRFKNPFIPLLNFTVATGLLVIAAHNRRHLWQAEQVAKHRDFPR